MEQHQIEHLKRLVASLAEWQLCMSYNDSYFGEPAGLVKRTSRELTKLIESAERTTAPVSLTDEQIAAVYEQSQSMTLREQDHHAVMAFARALLEAAPVAADTDSAIREAILQYYDDLSARKHGGVAQDKAFQAIQDALGMSWSSGTDHRAKYATPSPSLAVREKPNADCSGDPASCPDNEGYGCACDPMNKTAKEQP